MPEKRRGAVGEFYELDEFKIILNRAAEYAETDSQAQFVGDMAMRFRRYGLAMYVTERQLDWLYSIASFTE